MLDYKDKLTANPISYNFYIYETVITIYKTKFLIPIYEQKSYFSIHSISIDNLNTDDKKSAFISFKVFPQKFKLTIKYASLNDVLSNFGSFFSVFSLLCSIFSHTYSNFFYEADLLNAVYKFHHSKPGTIHFKSINFDKIESPKFSGIPPPGSQSDNLRIEFHSSRKEGYKSENQQSEIPNELRSDLFLSDVNFLKVSNDRKTLKSANNFRLLNGRKRGRELVEKEKELDKQRPDINVLDTIMMKSCRCCVKDDHKLNLLDNCLGLVYEFTQIENIIKSQIELIFLRKLLLNDSQNMLFQYLFKNIDFVNTQMTQYFLKEIREKQPILDFEKLNKMERDNPTNKYLIGKFEEFMYKR